AGLVKVGEIFLEGRTIFIELAAFFLEALELFVAILVERGIAGCRAIAAMTMAMATAARFEALLLVCDPAFGLFAAAAEIFAPKDVGEDGHAKGPEDDEAQDHQGDGQGRPGRFDNCGVHVAVSPVPNVIESGVPARRIKAACKNF